MRFLTLYASSKTDIYSDVVTNDLAAEFTLERYNFHHDEEVTQEVVDSVLRDWMDKAKVGDVLRVSSDGMIVVVDDEFQEVEIQPEVRLGIGPIAD